MANWLLVVFTLLLTSMVLDGMEPKLSSQITIHRLITGYQELSLNKYVLQKSKKELDALVLELSSNDDKSSIQLYFNGSKEGYPILISKNIREYEIHLQNPKEWNKYKIRFKGNINFRKINIP